MTTTQIVRGFEGCNTSPHVSLPTYLITYMRTGVLPVEVFNEKEARPETASTNLETTEEDSPIFGTHIREAIELIRGHR